MASPQKENGFTPIANEVMEALCGIRISGEARQCLDVIIRKTYGFQKKEDKISLSQFYLLTKMSKGSICRSLLKLAEMNLIINKKVNDNITSYRFNKDFDTWKPLTKKITINKKVNDHSQKSKSPLTKKRHTIDTLTKDTITIENTELKLGDKTNVKNLLDIFYKFNPGMNFGNTTERKACEWLIEKYGEEKAINTAAYAISIQAEKYAPKITTPYLLKTKLGDLLAYYKKQSNNQIQSL